jgi:hypothetical protein
MITSKRNRALLAAIAMVMIIAASARLKADTGTCGGASITLPFQDVPAGSVFFCSIAEAYFSGLSNGTSGTTYSPGNNVTRDQMAAFVTRTMDQSLTRGSRRAALDQFWTPPSGDGLRATPVGSNPFFVKSDGADLWVANGGDGTVSRVRASDGKLLETWTGAQGAFGIVAAKGLIFVTGFQDLATGTLYQIDPTQRSGAVTVVTNSLGAQAQAIAFDGARIWTANVAGTVSIVTFSPSVSVTTVHVGFDTPQGIIYDGANIWVTDEQAGGLLKLNSNGTIIQTVVSGEPNPGYPAFDGTNIWVPNQGGNSVSVVRASTGAVLANLTDNGLFQPLSAAFDGERILVTNHVSSSVSLWKATDLSPLGNFSTSIASENDNPFAACSDGLNFWITLAANKLVRF